MRSSAFPIDHFLEKRGGNGRLLQGGGVRSNILVITPVSDEPERLKKPYMADFLNMMQLCTYIRIASYKG